MLISKIISLNAIESVEDMALLEKYRAMHDLARAGAQKPTLEDKKVLIDGYGEDEGLSLFNDLVKRYQTAVSKRYKGRDRGGVLESERENFIKKRMDQLEKTLNNLEKTDSYANNINKIYTQLGSVISKWLFEMGEISAKVCLSKASGLDYSDKDFLFDEIVSSIVEQMSGFLTNKGAVVRMLKDDLTSSVDVVEENLQTSVDLYMRDKLRAPIKSKDPRELSTQAVRNSYNIHIRALKDKLDAYVPGETFKYDFKDHSFILDSKKAIKDAIDILIREKEEFATSDTGEKRSGVKHGYGVTISETEMSVIIDNLFKLFQDGIDLWFSSSKSYEDPYFLKDIGEMSGVSKCGVSLQELVQSIANKVRWRGIDIGKKIVRDYTRDAAHLKRFTPVEVQKDDSDIDFETGSEFDVTEDSLSAPPDEVYSDHEHDLKALSNALSSWAGDRDDITEVMGLGGYILRDIGNVYDLFMEPVEDGGIGGSWDFAKEEMNINSFNDLLLYYACADLNVVISAKVLKNRMDKIKKLFKGSEPSEAFKQLEKKFTCSKCQGDGVHDNKRCPECMGYGYINPKLSPKIYSVYSKLRDKFSYIKKDEALSNLNNIEYIFYLIYKEILLDYIGNTMFANNLNYGGRQLVFNKLYSQIAREGGSPKILKEIIGGPAFGRFYDEYIKTESREKGSRSFYDTDAFHSVVAKDKSKFKSMEDILSKYSPDERDKLTQQVIGMSHSRWEEYVKYITKSDSSVSKGVRSISSTNNTNLRGAVEFFKKFFDYLQGVDSHGLIDESSIVDEILDSYLNKMEFTSSDNINDVAISSEGREYSDMGRDKNDKLQNLLRGQFTSSHTMKDLWVLSEDKKAISVNSSYKRIDKKE